MPSWQSRTNSSIKASEQKLPRFLLGGLFALLSTAAPLCAQTPGKGALSFDKAQGMFVVKGLDSWAFDAFCVQNHEQKVKSFKVLPQFENQTDLSAFAMLGEYHCDAGKILFQPRFELQPELTYLAIFELASEKGTEVFLEHRLRLRRSEQGEKTRVLAVYPSGDQVPANLLKVYISFSSSMSRGFARDYVRLVNSEGKAIPGAFLTLEEELWNSQRTRLTLLLDPGRIKRGLAPNLSHGPPLAQGMEITLEIDKGWPDGRRNPLASPLRKTYRVVAEDRQAPQLKLWQWEKPQQGSRDPLILRFPEPLDYGLLHSGLVVADQAGRAMKGVIKSAAAEHEWHFVPASPWRETTYELQVTDRLEDLAGNNLYKTFDRDVSKPPLTSENRPTSRHIPFRLPPAKD